MSFRIPLEKWNNLQFVRGVCNEEMRLSKCPPLVSVWSSYVNDDGKSVYVFIRDVYDEPPVDIDTNVLFSRENYRNGIEVSGKATVEWLNNEIDIVYNPDVIYVHIPLIN